MPRGSGGEVKGWFLFLSQGDKREVYLWKKRKIPREREKGVGGFHFLFI